MHNHTEEILNTHSGLFFKHFFGKLGSLNPPKIYPSYHCICFFMNFEIMVTIIAFHKKTVLSAYIDLIQNDIL